MKVADGIDIKTEHVLALGALITVIYAGKQAISSIAEGATTSLTQSATTSTGAAWEAFLSNINTVQQSISPTSNPIYVQTVPYIPEVAEYAHNAINYLRSLGVRI